MSLRATSSDAMRFSMCTGLCIIVVLVLILAGAVYPDVPRKINYQGRLFDNVTGEPRVGSHSMTFRLFDVASGGTESWSETHVVLTDSAGVFSVILGSTNPVVLGFSVPMWLEVEVSGEVLVPRRELVSVPYAFQAEQAQSAVSADDALYADDALSAAEALHAQVADSLAGFSPGEFVMEGELASITAEMIVGGAGSGLDADFLDSLNADAFAGSSHVHDDRYYLQDTLTTPGALNDTGNPVDWTRLKGVPSGFADGTDDVGEAADGYSLDADDGDPVDALYVDSDGKVGIGTGAPQAKLDVAGTARVEGLTLPTGADSGLVLTSDADGTGTWHALPVYADTAHYHDDRYYMQTELYTQTELNTSDGDAPNVGSNRVSWDNLTDMPADFADGSDEAGGAGDGYSLDAVDGDPVDVIYVDETGYVGIGMDPEVALDIHSPGADFCYLRLSTAGTGTGFYDGTRLYVGPGGSATLSNFEAGPLQFGTDHSVRMVITAGGDVGIGTYSPLDLLHLHESAADQGCFQHWTNDATGTVFDDGFSVGIDADGNAYVNNYENTGLFFATNNHLRMYIAPDGDVGIGSLDPQANLHIHEGGIGGCYTIMTNTGTGTGLGSNGLVVGIASDGTALIGNKENNSMLFETQGNIAMTLTPERRLSIGGMTDPEHRLHLHTSSSDSATLGITNVITGHGPNDGLVLGIDEDGGAFLVNKEESSLQLSTLDNAGVTIDDLGWVGIGITSPASKLQVHAAGSSNSETHWTNGNTGTTYNDGLRVGITVDGNGYIRNSENKDLIFSTNGYERMRILADGSVGIGETDPSNDLDIKAENPYLRLNATDIEAALRLSQNGSTKWQLGWNQGSGYVYFWSGGGAGTSLVIEDDTGEVGIGTPSPSYKLDVAGEVHASSYPTSSDARFKQDVRQLTGVLDKLEQIRGVSFEWNDLYASLGRASGHREIGVIAQEVEAQFPELVTTWGEEDYRAVEYGRMTGVLIEAIKELRAENEDLRRRLEAVEGRMD